MSERAAPIFFFAPFVSSTMRVEPAWIDYNGHMNMAYYHVLFDRTVEEAFSTIGLGQEYAEERKASVFVAEVHTLYKRELTMHDRVRVTLQLIDFDEKRLHLYMEARHIEEGWVAATSEALFLHVDLESRKVALFPEDILNSLSVMKAAHKRLATPPALGRVMGIPSKTEIQETMLATGTRH
ncbi:thioesterase family protein [Microvirga flavescens]|uniref:thioesterase family protein n=1 Tax=Microvirga flavescens TaxID=2249811 RepID=UPI000DD69C2E|nr:thioesterase family protein [Microvirga flavescens]